MILYEPDSKSNFLLDALKHVIKYKENYEVMEKREQELIDKRGENYIKYEEEKDKYDRYCMHLNRYKEQKFIFNLSNVIIAAIDNNLQFFSKDDLQELLIEADKTKLKTVKISSPYTLEKQQQKTVPRFLIIIGIILVIIIIVYVVVLLLTKQDEEVSNTIVMEGVEYSELA
mgnify:CR=1 FL=1